MNVLTARQVEDLFEVFYESVNRAFPALMPLEFNLLTSDAASWSLLVSDWHTPTMVVERSPLLLLTGRSISRGGGGGGSLLDNTDLRPTVCTITARFHPPTQHLYSKLYALAREDATAVLLDGARVVETVQVRSPPYDSAQVPS